MDFAKWWEVINQICEKCGEFELDHCVFVPRPDMPSGCKCDPKSWGDFPSDICKEFKGDPKNNCNSCEHDFECHSVKE